jgi:hypothetical protein
VAELAKLKKVMAQQFLEEGRDKYGFVTKDGKLLGGTTYLYGKVVAEFLWNSYGIHMNCTQAIRLGLRVIVGAGCVDIIL